MVKGEIIGCDLVASEAKSRRSWWSSSGPSTGAGPQGIDRLALTDAVYLAVALAAQVAAPAGSVEGWGWG